MKLHLLGNCAPSGYTTWGCMWKKGEISTDSDYQINNESGMKIPVQSRVSAYWPDGSVKWTAHTADAAQMGKSIEVQSKHTPHKEQKNKDKRIQIKKKENGAVLFIDAGDMKVTVKKGTGNLLESASYCNKELLGAAKDVLILERTKTQDTDMTVIREVKAEYSFSSRVDQIIIEDGGELQTTIRFSGIHVSETGEERFPFVIRMKIGWNSPDLEFTHTFIYDGEEDFDFLKGIGIVFEVPMDGPLYNRHVKFAGDYGVFHETIAPLRSWHPHIPEEIRKNQADGCKLKLSGVDLDTVNVVMKDMPFWDEYTLCQDSESHFSIKKKIKDENCCCLDCLSGQRSDGGAALGSQRGSIRLTIRDFWEKYPSGYTFSHLTEKEANAAIWFWSPQGTAMDFRHYANRGYNQVCYEGYDYKGADPYGIACTSECCIRLSEGIIATDEEVKAFEAHVKYPPRYVGDPEFYHEMKAFGYWSLPDGSSETRKWLEEQLSRAFEFYRDEVQQRNWYGMFNYGDFMHSYDKDVHQWKYDMGGYAWDNTELMPTMWLWYYFLRTGREDVFLLAEKLSRHTSEVDVYHIGKFKGLGSRHNVRHWGCPCKEARIAMAGHHRVYYYLTGDRRLQDIFCELKDNEETFYEHDPLGDFYDKTDMVYPAHARSGPDWSSLCSNWMTWWEQTGDTAYRDKILVGLSDIKAAPLELISGPDFEFNPKNCHLRYIGERTTGGTHLQICMGAPEIWLELADLLEDEKFRQMMAEYGRFYYLSDEQRWQESKGRIENRQFTFPFMAAAMGGYGASRLKDEVLARKTWGHLFSSLSMQGNHDGFCTVILHKMGNKKDLKEIPWISTNFTAQWCLNVIVTLEFIGDKLPRTLKEADQLADYMDDKGDAFHKA